MIVPWLMNCPHTEEGFQKRKGIAVNVTPKNKRPG
jgi:hypothetical protein